MRFSFGFPCFLRRRITYHNINIKELSHKQYEFDKNTSSKFKESTVYEVPLKEIDLKDKKEVHMEMINLGILCVSIK